jgi:hypothetical protein
LFARPVRAEKREDLAFTHLERNVIDCREFTKRFEEIFHSDHAKRLSVNTKRFSVDRAQNDRWSIPQNKKLDGAGIFIDNRLVIKPFGYGSFPPP